MISIPEEGETLKEARMSEESSMGERKGRRFLRR